MKSPLGIPIVGYYTLVQIIIYVMTKNMCHTYTAERKLISVPGNNSYSCGVGTIKLKVHNKVTNQYDVVVLTGVSHLLNAPNLISTGKLNKIDLHMDTVNNELFHIKRINCYPGTGIPFIQQESATR